MIGDIRVWRTICSDDSTVFSWYALDLVGFKCLIQHWYLFWKLYEKVSRKPSINREDKSKSSKFIYSVIIFAITMNLLSVITPPTIYHFCNDKMPFLALISQTLWDIFGIPDYLNHQEPFFSQNNPFSYNKTIVI